MAIRLELEPNELDVVMKHLTVGQWQTVQAVINKIISQANDTKFQHPPIQMEIPDHGHD